MFDRTFDKFYFHETLLYFRLVYIKNLLGIYQTKIRYIPNGS